MRVAVYARFSSDLQRATSINDQIDAAKAYARASGWMVLEDHVYTDAALSGSSLDRPGIRALMVAAARRPRQFDVLLVDDSSRISRDLADAIRLLQELRFHGVRVIYISQNIDSAHEQAETLIAVHGVVDSLYLREMAKKIKRGLAGQLERGFATGSITFGYRTVPVPDPSGKTDVNGYPVLIGKRVEIVPEEARTVVLIFEWYAAGLGSRRIVQRLNREGHRGPRGGRWKEGAVKRVLANEKYRGMLIWGKKTFDRKPGTRHHVERPVARDEWRTLDRPDLRIVDQDLWSRVQRRREEVRGTLPPAMPTLMRGRNATLHSKHLFSGFLRCGVCGAAVTVVSGGYGNPRYGCSQSWRNGVDVCSNRLTIRAKVADARLLDGLRQELLAVGTVRYVSDSLAAALNERLNKRPQLLKEAKAAYEQAKQRLQRLIGAIENGVPAASLAGAIAEREAELALHEAAIAELYEPPPQPLAIIPAWVRQQLEDLSGLLAGAPERTKAEFGRLGLKVVIDPIRDEQPRPFLRAKIDVALPCLAGIRDLSSTAVDRLLPPREP
jgi:DNA invertase Pin-like site-specific DNA recombinase